MRIGSVLEQGGHDVNKYVVKASQVHIGTTELEDRGGCQNYGPFLGTLNIRGRIIIGTQKGTIILTASHMTVVSDTYNLNRAGPLLGLSTYRKFFRACLRPH